MYDHTIGGIILGVLALIGVIVLIGIVYFGKPARAKYRIRADIQNNVYAVEYCMYGMWVTHAYADTVEEAKQLKNDLVDWDQPDLVRLYDAKGNSI